MNSEGVDGEFWVQRAEPVDVVDHGQEKGRYEGGMSSQAMKVIPNRDAWRGSACKAESVISI